MTGWRAVVKFLAFLGYHFPGSAAENEHHEQLIAFFERNLQLDPAEGASRSGREPP
jgi:hypothetical protein